MNVEFLSVTDGISGAIGVIAPFLLPFVFKFLEKIFKREISKEEKRAIISYIAVTVAVGIVFVQYQWVGSTWHNIQNLAFECVEHFAIIKGMVQIIYEGIIKEVPEVDAFLTRQEK